MGINILTPNMALTHEVQLDYLLETAYQFIQTVREGMEKKRRVVEGRGRGGGDEGKMQKMLSSDHTNLFD